MTRLSKGSPYNLFVAGFIGSPQMNFFDAKLVKNGDTYTVECAGAVVDLPADKQAALAANGVESKDITIGIRPDHIVLAEEGDKAAVEATVDVTELMGSTIHMHVNVNGKDAIIILPTIDLSSEQKNGFNYGTKINVTFGGNVVHMFCKATEKNLI